jgi:hypothetical protein
VAELCDHHSVLAFHAARKRGTIALLVLAFLVVPDLAVGTFTVPTKIAVRNRVDREVLKAAQQPVFFRHFN